MASPTARTLAYLKQEGWTPAVVERWIPQARKRIDVYGFADLLAFRGPEVALVQTTSATNHASRRAKIACSPLARAWAQHGRKIMIVSWGRRGGRGKRKLWTARTEMFDYGER